jgi:hypothetical protein
MERNQKLSSQNNMAAPQIIIRDHVTAVTLSNVFMFDV